MLRVTTNPPAIRVGVNLAAETKGSAKAVFSALWPMNRKALVHLFRSAAFFMQNAPDFLMWNPPRNR